MMRCCTTVLVVLCCLVLPGVCAGATWSEPMFGISIDYPDTCGVVEQTTDRALVKFVGHDGVVGSLYLETQEQDWDLPAVKKRALSQLAFGAKQPLLVEESPHRTMVADHRAHWWTLRTQTENGGDVLLGQLFIMLSPRRVAVIQVEAAWEQRDEATRLLHALREGFSVEAQERLAEEHLERLRAGDRWLGGVLEAMATQAETQTRWYLIESEGRAIGYERRVVRPTTELGVSGLSVEVRRHVETNRHHERTIVRAFASADRQVEIWEARTTVTAADRPGGAGLDSATTAVRSGEVLSVTFESPTRTWQREFPIPDMAYLPLAHQLAMGVGWRDAASEPVAYFSYYMPVELMAFAIADVTASPAGWDVRLYPAPKRAAQRLRFGRDGALLRHETPDGRVVRVVSPGELRAVFGDERIR
ncbi:hypothetical protein [Mucisphaera calidilacus]|uniref:Uncharacterized protein n=1 Tax=Mucisphaera calidilacus TaxID=2527982 RepID=A0A518BYT4_9BACT|nr:hypothetical protein [Mucisphaera calidilacus]QDU72135.1 hypothetical protein Pan265_19980 [Mucisphaera calidilacus]